MLKHGPVQTGTPEHGHTQPYAYRTVLEKNRMQPLSRNNIVAIIKMFIAKIK